jgi:hypothetical protein
VPPVPKETLLERLPAALEAHQAAGGGDQKEERGFEEEPTEEHAERGASRKGKRPIEPMPSAEEVAKEAAKRSKRAKKGEKAATGVEESSGMECPLGEEMAAGSESAASKQVAPVLGAGEGEKTATGVEESAGMECPPGEEEAPGLQSSAGVAIAPAPKVQVPPLTGAEALSMEPSPMEVELPVGAAGEARGAHAAEGAAFVLGPMLQNAVAHAVDQLAGGEDLPWLDQKALTTELVRDAVARLEELRAGVTTRPLRMEEAPEGGTGEDAGNKGPQQPPPPPARPRDGPQQPPPLPTGPRGEPPQEPQREKEPPPSPPAQEEPPAVQAGSLAVQEEPPAEENPPASEPGGPPATSAMYVGTRVEYLAGAADATTLLEMAEPSSRARLAQGLSAMRAKGHQLDERVQAPMFDTEKGGVWVNGKPITGVAIFFIGPMPLLAGRAGMEQLGWTDEDVIPNAISLGLANAESTQLQGLTRKTMKLTFNKGGKWETSIAVRAVVT